MDVALLAFGFYRGGAKLATVRGGGDNLRAKDPFLW